MPVSHIGLTVSHLPTSTSFFLSALQPLGYRFIGQQGNQIGLGIKDADFFICQETPGVKAGAAHIAFTAPSQRAVRDFYTAALNAGGRPNGAPACRTEDEEHFNAAVLDFDGNSIEVVYRNGPDFRDDGTVVEHSRVITWTRSTVTSSVRDNGSVISTRSSRPPLAAAKAPSVVSAASTLSKAASMARSMSAPVVPAASSAETPQVTVESTTTTKFTASGDGAAKRIIGTLLGAAAGAAVAYAMVKSEEDSTKKEAQFEAFMHAKSAASQAKDTLRQVVAIEQQPPQAQPMYESPPKSVYADEARSVVYAQRQIEGPPPSYHAGYTTVAPTQVGESAHGQRAIEYVPAASVAGSHVWRSSRASRSGFGAPKRSLTSPELSTVSASRARSTVSQSQHSHTPRSVAPSAAPSTLISSFVAEEHIPRRSSDGSITSYTSTSTSKTKSARSKAASIVGSILGRGGDNNNADAASTVSRKSRKGSGSPFSDYYEIEDHDKDASDSYDDADTVAPSDSISNAGSRSSRRSHRSHSSRSEHGSHHSHRSHRSSRDRDDASIASYHTSHSKSSKHSKHNSSSHASSPRHHSSSASHHSRSSKSVISEPSDASTIKPSRSRPSTSRKDSVASGQYDNLYDEARSMKSGKGSGVSVAGTSIPIRGITPSMIDGSAPASGREQVQPNLSAGKSMMSFAMGQRLRAFEGR